MKKIEIGLIGILLLTILINIFIADSSDSSDLLVTILFLVSMVYFFGGYFIFKPKEPFKAWQFFSILNGVLLSIAIAFVCGKFYDPGQDTPVASIVFGPPLILLMCYFAFKAYRKKGSDELKAHFNLVLKKNTLLLFLISLFTYMPADIFAEYIYGTKSNIYYHTLQKVYLDNAYVLRDQGEYVKAIEKLNAAIKYSELQEDRSSFLFQQCLNELGYVNYRQQKYYEADSVLNKVLSLYAFESSKKIKEIYNEDYQTAFYDAVFTKALVYSMWGSYHKSDSLFSIALDHYKDEWNRAYINSYLGFNQFSVGNFKTADSLYELTIEYHKKSNFLHKANYLSTLIDLSKSKMENSNFQAADSILKLSYTYAKTGFGLTSNEVSNVLDVFVTLNINKAQFGEAEKYCLESLKIKEGNFGKKNEEYINSNLDLAIIYLSTSKFLIAKSLLKEMEIAIDANLDWRGPTATKLYDILTNYNEDLMNYSQANEYADKSIKGRCYWDGKYHLNTATSYHNMASVQYFKGNYKSSDSLYSLALRIKKYYKGLVNPNYVASLNGLSLVYIERDSIKLAYEYLNFSLKVCDKFYGNNHPAYATVLYNIGFLNMKQKKLVEAETELKRVLEIYDGLFKGKHFKKAKTYFALGNLEKLKGNNSKAISYYNNSIENYKDLLSENHYYIKYLRNEISSLKE